MGSPIYSHFDNPVQDYSPKEKSRQTKSVLIIHQISSSSLIPRCIHDGAPQGGPLGTVEYPALVTHSLTIHRHTPSCPSHSNDAELREPKNGGQIGIGGGSGGGSGGPIGDPFPQRTGMESNDFQNSLLSMRGDDVFVMVLLHKLLTLETMRVGNYPAAIYGPLSKDHQVEGRN
eukprot:scaffold2645_cov139-Amphora_coffeaeformis.AAC.1